MTLSFVKMNGLGNDFVVIASEEAGAAAFTPGAAEARAIANRRRGIGCDQLIVLSPSPSADAAMRVWNADGGEVGACGNGARCAAWLVLQASHREVARLETPSGVLVARRAPDGQVTVNMGRPALDWREIPLAEARDTRGFVFAPPGRPGGDLGFASAVSMGNPHVVFFVADAEELDVERLGPLIERDSLFPDRANVGFAQIESREALRLRVWERGAGKTRACGTGACAAVVAAARRDLTGRRVTVRMDGGDLEVDWRADDHVELTGPVEIEFTGRLPDLEIA